MIFILFIGLFIICLLIVITLNRALPFIRTYEETEKAYTDIFVVLRKRKEYLFDNYPHDLDLLAYYESLEQLDLLSRLEEELALRSIDDTFDDYRKEVLSKIGLYNEKVCLYQKEAAEHRLLYKLLAFKMYEMIDRS